MGNGKWRLGQPKWEWPATLNWAFCAWFPMQTSVASSPAVPSNHNQPPGGFGKPDCQVGSGGVCMANKFPGVAYAAGGEDRGRALGEPPLFSPLLGKLLA